VSVPHLPAQLARVGGTQATHWFVFASQICDAPASFEVGHEPQSKVTPHVSTMTPHSAPAFPQAAFFDSHRCVSGSHTSAAGQVPQLTV
jgi:hypothetical protein